MPPKNLKVFAIDPGKTTGWAIFIVPRMSIFGDEDTEVIWWDTGEITGEEEEQAAWIARKSREIQNLDFRIGPAVIVEAFDFGAPFTDPEVYSPVRIGAMLRMAKHMGLMGDSIINFQGRTIAKSTATDERLRLWGYWVPGSTHKRDAVRHAITVLRRAKQKASVRNKLWSEWAQRT